jgi:hypothetical protein
MKQLTILEPAELEAIGHDQAKCRGNYLVMENSCVLVATMPQAVASLHKLARAWHFFLSRSPPPAEPWRSMNCVGGNRRRAQRKRASR